MISWLYILLGLPILAMVKVWVNSRQTPVAGPTTDVIGWNGADSVGWDAIDEIGWE